MKSKRCCSNHISSTKFGSYLQSTTCTSLFCFPSNLESSESWFAQYLSLFELFSRKSWSQCKKTTRRTFRSSELTTDLTLYSTRTSKIEFTSCTLFGTLRKRTCLRGLTTSLELYSARTQNAQKSFMSSENDLSHSIWCGQKTHMSIKVDYKSHSLIGTHRTRTCQVRLTSSLLLY